MKKAYTLLILLLISQQIYSQKHKIELTEGCVIMKDPVAGGIYDIFDWKKTSGTLIYDASNNLIEITEDGKVANKFYITETLKKIETDKEVKYIFSCLQTSSYDEFKSSSQGQVKLNLLRDENTKRSVLIFENDALILIYRGGFALKNP